MENDFKFRDKNSLKVPLISDKDQSPCEGYDVWTKKMNYGTACTEIKRMNDTIGQKGKVAKALPRFA